MLAGVLQRCGVVIAACVNSVPQRPFVPAELSIDVVMPQSEVGDCLKGLKLQEVLRRVFLRHRDDEVRGA